MQRARIPTLGFGTSSWHDAGPDPAVHPAAYRNIVGRRFLAWLVDAVILLVLVGGAFVVLLISNIVTFGLLALPVSLAFLLVPLVYYTVLLGGPRAATPGMRLIGIELRSWDNARPNYFQALLRTVLHYATVTLLSPLVLVVMLCNERGRAAHDYLSGTVVVNASPAAAAQITARTASRPPVER